MQPLQMRMTFPVSLKGRDGLAQPLHHTLGALVRYLVKEVCLQFSRRVSCRGKAVMKDHKALLLNLRGLRCKPHDNYALELPPG